MAIRARKLNMRQALTSDARAWLDGKQCGFFQFKSQDELSALWAEHGDSNSMFWRSRYCLPITVEELGELEEAWLKRIGSRSSFIDRHYTDEERQTLWSERGDKKPSSSARSALAFPSSRDAVCMGIRSEGCSPRVATALEEADVAGGFVFEKLRMFID
jgi:hypothetical protein